MIGPKLPSQRELSRQLRELNEAFKHPIAGGEYVVMVITPSSWRLVCAGDANILAFEYPRRAAGKELVPGSDQFDSVGAARRLLSDARSIVRDLDPLFWIRG